MKPQKNRAKRGSKPCANRFQTKRAATKQFGFHGIRHLFASILASQNVPLVEIQKMLRHGSITTTARYIHSLGSGNREVVEVLPGLKDRTETKQKNAVC
ncbi:MAG: tyrosine-type recombinase/integrase [Desulfobulbus sp.]